MASSTNIYDAFSGRPAYRLRLHVYRHTTDYALNRSRYGWILYAEQVDSGTTWAGDPQSWTVTIGGVPVSGSHAMDFRSTTSIQMGSGVTGFFNHNSDGYLNVALAASINASGTLFGTASASGILYADRIAQTPDAPPTATFVNATASSLSFTIAQPADNGGSAVLDYTLELSTNSGFTGIVQTRVSGASAQTFSGLDANVTYYLRYRARNAVGTGPNSGTRTAATLAGVPSQTRSPSATSLLPTSFTLNWLAPTSNGGAAITTYRIQKSPSSTFASSVTEYTQGATLSRAFTGLAPSSTTYYRIRAENSAGAGAWSSTLAVTTVSGVYYSNGTTWLPCGVFVSIAAGWIPAELAVSDGTNWDNAI